MERKSTILDGKFFKVLSSSDDGLKVKAECQLCKKSYSGSYTGTANFKNHLKSVHGEDAIRDFENYKIESKTNKRKNADVASGPRLKQQKISAFASTSANSNAVPQSKVDSLIVNYIVKGLRPLSTVEDPGFLEFVDGLRPGTNVMSRRTLGRRINEKYVMDTKKIQDKLSGQSNICTTADIWSTKTTSFMGVTAHWIDTVSLQRESVALACKSFPSPHTYDRIAECLHDISVEFNIQGKIIATVTDNASNFVKAFREFGVTNSVFQEAVESEDELDARDTSEVSDEDTSDEVLFVNDIVMEPEDDCSIQLPHHLRCASHTLSLIGTTDAKKALARPSYARLNHTTMGKCSSLWTLAGRPKSAEKISQQLGHQLSYPCPTRWNSLYDSIKQILRDDEKLPALFEALNLPKFKESELEFLEEYVKVMRPIASALDMLQGDKNTYYGQLLPTLFAIQPKLKAMEGSVLKHSIHLLQCVSLGLETRFQKFFELNIDHNMAILASISHPFFKLRWIPKTEPEQKIKCQAIFLRAAERIAVTSSYIDIESPSISTVTEESFFVFESTEATRPNSNMVELEILNYLGDQRTDIQMLHQYPTVKKIFCKYNSILPSSAPVERLFSFAGMVNQPKRRRLSPNMFQKLVIMKAN